MKRLEEFHKFTKIKDYDSYLNLDNKTIENMIMEYVILLKKKIEKGIITPNAIVQRIAPIELFMSQNDIMINTKKIHRMYPRKIKTKGELPYMLDDLQSMLSTTTKLRDKVLITFFASTGVRPESIVGLKFGDLKEMDMGCMTLKIYENDIEEYPCFLTPECVRYLEKYFKQRKFHGEMITSESPVFRMAYNKRKAEFAKPISYEALKASMYDIIQRARIRNKFSDSGKRHDKAMFGGFRKFFETALNNNKEINPNVTEKLMGHRNDLRGVYYNPNIDVRFENFKKAIPDLTVSEVLRLEEQNKRKDDRIQKLETDKDRRIDKLEKSIVGMQRLLKHANSIKS